MKREYKKLCSFFCAEKFTIFLNFLKKEQKRMAL